MDFVLSVWGKRLLELIVGLFVTLELWQSNKEKYHINRKNCKTRLLIQFSEDIEQSFINAQQID